MQMVGIKQKILRSLLAISLVLAPMGSAVAAATMGHSSMAQSVDLHTAAHGTMHHGADVKKVNSHCNSDNSHPSDELCQHSCCGDCFSSAGFILSYNSTSPYADRTPPFVNTFQVLLATFSHYRPPA